MPIYEFKCLKCEDFFELLIMNNEEQVESACPSCKSEDFERELSSTNYAMGVKSVPGAQSQTRSCSSGSCTTYDVPGPSR